MPLHSSSSGAWAKVHPQGTLHLHTSNQSPVGRQPGTSAIASSSTSGRWRSSHPAGRQIKGRQVAEAPTTRAARFSAAFAWLRHSEPCAAACGGAPAPCSASVRRDYSALAVAPQPARDSIGDSAPTLRRDKGGPLDAIAVGTAVAGGPPRRSQRARLTHWAPALGSGVKARRGPRVLDAGQG